MTPTSPRDVLARAHAYVRDYDIRFVDCFAADGVLELPFAPTGMPKRLAGRDAIRRTLEPSYRAAKLAGRQIIEYRETRVHETADPEVVVVEFTLLGAQAGRTAYQLPFIQVARVRGGEIVELRDYFDSLAMRSLLASPAPASGPSPRAVFEQLIAGIAGQHWDTLPMLYAENTVVTHPHDLPRPTRLEGRDQLRAHFATMATLPIRMQARNVVVHETTDPEVIIAEYDYLGSVTPTGRTFQLSVVLVMRIRNGQIVTSHDYGNHAAAAEALGALPALWAQFEAIHYT